MNNLSVAVYSGSKVRNLPWLYEHFPDINRAPHLVEHRDLAECLNNHNGPAMVCGYESDLYAELYQAPRWRLYKQKPNFRNQNMVPRVECLWTNYEPHGQKFLFFS